MALKDQRRVPKPPLDLFALLFVGAVTVLAFLAHIVPKFDRVFAQLNAPLPPLTQAVVTASRVVANPAGAVTVLFVLLAMARAIGILLRQRWAGLPDRDLERQVVTVVAVVLVGGLVGAMVVSMYLPIFKSTHCV